MILKADLYTDRGIWRSDSAYVFAVNDPLSVCFGEAHAGETLFVRGAFGSRSIRLDENGIAVIPVELIANGALLMNVGLYDNGKLIRDWNVDPLSIVIADDAVTATPWTVSVDERLAALENAILGYSSPIFE